MNIQLLDFLIANPHLYASFGMKPNLFLDPKRDNYHLVKNFWGDKFITHDPEKGCYYFHNPQGRGDLQKIPFTYNDGKVTYVNYEGANRSCRHNYALNVQATQTDTPNMYNKGYAKTCKIPLLPLLETIMSLKDELAPEAQSHLNLITPNISMNSFTEGISKLNVPSAPTSLDKKMQTFEAELMSKFRQSPHYRQLVKEVLQSIR